MLPTFCMWCVNYYMSNIDVTLRDRLASLVSAMDVEFVGCEMQRRGRGSVLRIYIDTDQGVTLEDCTRVSRQVSAMLDVDDPIQGEYHLEISSPGIDRPLFDIAHFEKYAGNQVKLRAYAPIEGRRKFTGKLLRVEGTDVILLVDAEEIVVPFSNIEKANIIADNRVWGG